jgi:acyl carrier protein
MNIEAQLRKYILQNFMYTDDESRLTRDTSLIDSGVMDSTGVLELVGFIEQQYGFKVDDTELIPENFDSVAKLVAFVESKKAAA